MVIITSNTQGEKGLYLFLDTLYKYAYDNLFSNIFVQNNCSNKVELHVVHS